MLFRSQPGTPGPAHAGTRPEPRPDDVIHTRDDVLLTVPVRDGTLAVSGLPAGRYAVESAGASTPVTLDAGRTTTMSVRARAQLPFTGLPAAAGALAALLTLGLGIVLTLAGRDNEA